MAEPSRETAARASTVSSCGATECRHNEERECHAGEIAVEMKDGMAVCRTYDPEKPKARP